MTNQEIKDTFLATWEEFGDDKSTDFLIAITAERCGVNFDHVLEALARLNGGRQ